MTTNLNGNNPVDQAALDRMFELEKEIAQVLKKLTLFNILIYPNGQSRIIIKNFLNFDLGGHDYRRKTRSTIYQLYIGCIKQK